MKKISFSLTYIGQFPTVSLFTFPRQQFLSSNPSPRPPDYKTAIHLLAHIACGTPLNMLTIRAISPELSRASTKIDMMFIVQIMRN